MTNHTVRTRYAPSPTGHLHIGGARTALFCYLLAKQANGQFVVRIEDTDQERNVEDAEQKQLENLRWLGLQWDESVDIGGPYAPYRSMERLDIYETYINQLLEQGKAYRCYCSKEVLDREREAQLAKGEVPRYSGRCRHLSDEDIRRYEAEGKPSIIRFRVPAGKTIVVDDIVRGRVTFDSDGIGDFVIARADGRPMYNFAVTVDDALMKITHVVRGEEHLSNTPIQMLLYEALGFKAPRFAHVSLILNQDGQKMSKRDETIMQFVSQYREEGYVPEALINYFALLGWAPPGEHSEEEIFSLDELIKLFSLDRVSKSPAIFDPEKLKWMNNHYLKQLAIDELLPLTVPHLEKAGLIPKERSLEEDDWVRRLVGLYQEQLKYGAEIVQLAELFFMDELTYDDDAIAVLKEPHVLDVLTAFRQALTELEDFSPESMKQALKQTQKRSGYKGKKLFMPIRVALTGRIQGPDLTESLYLIGKERVTNRLRSIVDNYEQFLQNM